MYTLDNRAEETSRKEHEVQTRRAVGLIVLWVFLNAMTFLRSDRSASQEACTTKRLPQTFSHVGGVSALGLGF